MSTATDLYVGPYLGLPLPKTRDIYLHTQNAPITAQPLLGANTQLGTYLVALTCCLNGTGGSAGTITLSVACVGENGSNTNTYSLPAIDSGGTGLNMVSQLFVVSADGTGDITYQVDFTGLGTVGPLDYNIRVTALQLTNLT